MGRAVIAPIQTLLAAAAWSFSVFGNLAASGEPQTGTKPVQSQRQFEEAIRDQLNSPFFVVVTIVDDRTGLARNTCITANLFRGAIHREYGLAYDRASLEKVTEIALSSPDHVFHFSKQEALDNLPHYSDEELASARKTIEGLDENQLAGPFFRNKAVGCALVERGLSARMGDRGGEIRGFR
jgi:hypothetical protein